MKQQTNIKLLIKCSNWKPSRKGKEFPFENQKLGKNNSNLTWFGMW